MTDRTTRVPGDIRVTADGPNAHESVADALSSLIDHGVTDGEPIAQVVAYVQLAGEPEPARIERIDPETNTRRRVGSPSESDAQGDA